MDTKFVDKTREDVKITREFEYKLCRINGYSVEDSRRMRDWRSNKIFIIINGGIKIKHGN